MNPPGSLGSFKSFLDGPGFHLVRAGSKEVLELQSFVALKFKSKLLNLNIIFEMTDLNDYFV